MTEFASNWNVSDHAQRDDAIVPTDEDLVERIARGQRHAFDLLVTRYGSRLQSFLRHLLSDRTTAEDLTQEVLLKVLLHAGSRDPRSRFSVWLFCVARREAVDHLRRRKLHTRLLSVLRGGFEELARGLAPSSRLESDEFRRDYERALKRLPADQREVFLLRERAGMNYEEIGEVVGAPAKTVSTRLFRARTRLRELLQHHLGPGEGVASEDEANLEDQEP